VAVERIAARQPQCAASRPAKPDPRRLLGCDGRVLRAWRFHVSIELLANFITMTP